MGSQMMAIVAQGPKGRVYLLPDAEHARTAGIASARQRSRKQYACASIGLPRPVVWHDSAP